MTCTCPLLEHRGSALDRFAARHYQPVAVRSPLTQARVSALLLLVQVAALGHVAVAKHALSESGSLVDVAPLLNERHQERSGHLCADDVAVHADAPDECAVLAQWRARSVPVAALALGAVPQSCSTVLLPSFEVAVQLDALSRAPKASPPQG